MRAVSPGSLGNMTCTERVDTERPVRVALAIVDRGERSNVEDDLRSQGGDGGENLLAPCDIENCVRRGDDIRSRPVTQPARAGVFCQAPFRDLAGKRHHEVVTELTRGAGYEDPSRGHLLRPSPEL
jgi:hypothetical protein